MADETADLKVRARYTGERELRKLKRDLVGVTAAAAMADRKLSKMGMSSGTLEKNLKKTTRKFEMVFDDFSRFVRGMGSVITKTISMSAKLFVGEFGLMAAAMIGLHALFGVGRWLMKGYHGAIKMVSAGAAGATAALAALSAALREQQTVMFGYQGLNLGFKELGGNMSSVRTVVRSLHSDANLASAGMENLNAAFAAVNQKSTFTAGSQGLLSGLMDFASAGQPLDKGIKAAGEFIGVLQDVESNWSQIVSAGEALGPQMKKALEEAAKGGVKDVEALKKSILTGDLSLLGGVAGQWNMMNDTLVSRFKKSFTLLRTQFADLGDSFLPALKEGLEKVTNIITRMMFRIRGDIGLFGKGTFVDVLVAGVEKLESGMTKLIHTWLPMATGMFNRIGGWWKTFGDGWERIVIGLQPLLKGAEVLEDMFMNILRPLGSYFSETFGSFNKLLLSNRDVFLEFGDALGTLLTAFLSLQSFFKELFIDSMPFFIKIMEGLAGIINNIESGLRGISKVVGGLGGALGPFMMLMGLQLAGRQMKANKGVHAPVATQMMNVTANGPVNVGGVGVSGITGQGQISQKAQGPFYAGGGGGAAAGGGAGGFHPVTGQAARPGHMYQPYTHAGTGAQGFKQVPIPMGGGGGGGDVPEGGARSSLRQDFGTKASRKAEMDALRKGEMNKPGVKAPKRGYQRWNMNRRLGQETAAGQRLTAMDKSMSGRMGAGLGLGMLAQYGPEEMQGAMGLGSMVGMFHARGGLAVGGVGGAMQAESVMGGMGAGAMGGAALGSMLMPLNPLVGAAVGALVGGVLGGVKGALNRFGAERARVKESAIEAASQVVDAMTEGLNQVISEFGRVGMTSARVRDAYDLKGRQKLLERIRKTKIADPGAWANGTTGVHAGSADLSQPGTPGAVSHQAISDADRMLGEIFADADKYGIELNSKQIEEALKNPLIFLREHAEALDPSLQGAAKVLDKYEARVDFLGETFGLTEERTRALADAAGINLYDAFGNMTTMTRDLARQMVITQAKIESMWGNFIADQIIDPLLDIQKISNAPNVIDELGRGFMESVNAGDMDEAGVVTFIQGLMGGLIDFGGNEYATSEIIKMLGPDGSAFSQAGGPLEGEAGRFQTPMLKAWMEELVTAQDIKEKATLREFVVGGGAAAGLGIGGVSGGDVQALTMTQQEGLRAYMQSDAFTNVIDGMGDNISPQMREQIVNNVQSKLRSFGLDEATVGRLTEFERMSTDEKMGTAAESLTDAAGTMKDAMDLIIQQLSPGGTSPSPHAAPDTNRPIGDVGSTMSQTMNKYSALDGQLPGTRTITSGYRNYALGSIKSDHVMGRALDVVGSNLVGLQGLTQAAGGFAEFHGSGKGRHLHMVPNAAQGDTSSPAGGGGASSTYNYTINVEGGPNAHPQEVARLVMAEIERTSRNRRERA